MTFIYFICFLLITVGVIILLRLNPEKITDDLMRFVSPKQTLREKVQTAKGKKRSRKLTVELNRIRDALEQTGKGGQFSIACAASVVLMIFGCILATCLFKCGNERYLLQVKAPDYKAKLFGEAGGR